MNEYTAVFYGSNADTKNHKKITVFIDGGAGTTGLQIAERLGNIPEVEIIKLPDALRKVAAARSDALHHCDAAVLCLPDDAAREAVALAEGSNCVIFDASTAHRTADGWAYGFPELSTAHTAAIKSGNRIAVPGCHASGFAAIVYPLVQAGIIQRSDRLSCTSLTGYSGGGKSMIEEFESGNSDAIRGALPYALGLSHKHLPEMNAVCGLEYAPVFMPVLAPVRQGMIVTVPLAGVDSAMVHEVFAKHYDNGGNVRVMPHGGADFLKSGRLTMEDCNDTDMMEIFVFGDSSQTLCVARFDNLGKGAAGAAVQCLKLRFEL